MRNNYPKPIINEIFKRWQIVSGEPIRVGHSTKYLCRCLDCNTEKYVATHHLRAETHKRCKSCLKKYPDYKIGDVIGNYIILGPGERKNNSDTYYLCRCKLCNSEKSVAKINLIKGKSLNCRTCGSQRYWTSKTRDWTARVYKSYRGKAQKENRDFTLSREEFAEIIKQDCAYCGDAGVNVVRKYYGTMLYNGIDRVDNSRGYTLDNVVPCCHFCNMAKNKHTREMFFDKVRKIYNKHLKEKSYSGAA